VAAVLLAEHGGLALGKRKIANIYVHNNRVPRDRKR